MFWGAIWPAVVWLVWAGAGEAGALSLCAAPAGFNVEHTVLLNEAARRDKEVSYKIRADLHVLPVWRSAREDDECLLQFELVSPQLLSRGAHPNADYAPQPSVWDDYPLSSCYAHWSRGLVRQLYLDPTELLDVQNFKRSLVSLFQLQVSETQSNETDFSGQCAVQYELTSDTTIRKIKHGCSAAGWEPADGDGNGEGEEEGELRGEGNGEEEGEVQSRRLTRYSLNAARDALEEVYAEELHTLGTAAAGAGLKARSWARLQARTPPTPRTVPTHATLAHALPAALRPAPLSAAPPADLHADDESAPSPGVAELGALAAVAGGAAPGAGGELGTARAALALLEALPHAAPHALQELLHDGVAPDTLSGVCAALGLWGSAVAHRAASAFLRLRHGDAPRDLAHGYFAALAHAPRPHDAVVEDALRMGAELADPALAESALLGAAAAARRATPAARRRVRDALAGALARCASDECRRVRLAALGNLRPADAAPLLLEHAEGGGAAAGAALDALDALLTARGALPAAAPERLERVALGGAALETRAAALDLLLRAAAHAPWSLPRVLLALRAAREHELLRLALARLRALAVRHAGVRRLLRALPAALRGWDAPGGSSSLLEREAAAGAGWRGALESRQVARGALLRRGAVRLLALSPRNRTDDTLTVELWTRGLDALAGTGADAEAEEEAGGGLALSVGGARLRALTLFRGQAELLAHVWAGSASAPTPVLRALRPLPAAAAARPLLGGAALRYSRRALLAAALDAEAQVSLWARTARARLALRVSLVARGAAHVRTAWGALAARAHSEAEARLRVDADLDFYDAAALCVRAATAPHHHSYNVTLTSGLGARARRVRRTRAQRWAWDGRTLALGAPNDATCRTMGAAGD